MTLHPEIVGPVPSATAAVAHAAFPRGNVYLAMRDVLGTLFTDHDFVALFPHRGQPAYAPWRLALVTIMQFAEGFTLKGTRSPSGRCIRPSLPMWKPRSQP